MIDNFQRKDALEFYENAMSLFSAGHFARAQQMIRKYRQNIDYAEFQHTDNRDETPGRAAVIIITRDRGKELLDCLHSLKIQEGPPFEIIVVDNGSKIPVQEFIINEKVLLVECPIPFTPSEGRNIGAFFARADLLIFLDDDALAESGFVKSAVLAFKEHPFLGIRGRILPKSPRADHGLAGLYDLGNYPLPAILDIEGNMAVPKKMYHAVQGMNPLLFGAEGTEFTACLLQVRPEGDVYYWPGMVVRHDYAAGGSLLAKRKRQALTNEYFRTMYPAALEIKGLYTRVHQWRREKENSPFLKSLPARIRNVCRDMGLALKSEKLLNKEMSQANRDIGILKDADRMKSRAASEGEANVLSERVHTLEAELETVRKSFVFKLGNLINEIKLAPLRQGMLFPIRLVRLVKESITKYG